jgi:Glycine transporter
VAAAGGLAAFALSSQLARLATLITVLDAAGLGLFAVTGASKALGLGLGAAPAVILGAVTGVGGGTLRDVLLGQIPSVLQRGLYAIPALSAAAITVTAIRAGICGLPAAAGAVLACFLIRVLGVRYDLNAPMAPEPAQAPAGAGERKPRSRSRFPGLPGLCGHPGTSAGHRAVRDAVTRADLSRADPTPAGDASSPGPA